MQPSSNRRALLHQSVLVLVLLAAASTSASAQWTSRIGLGYVANLPEEPIGVSAHVLTMRWGGIGLYVDAKFEPRSPRDRENFDPNLTARQVEDQIPQQVYFSTEERYRSINAAIMRPVSPELIVYLGAGLVRRETFVEYFDPQHIHDDIDFYWVEDDETPTRGTNVMAGAIFRISPRFSLQFGVEAVPRGGTVGGSFSLPMGL